MPADSACRQCLLIYFKVVWVINNLLGMQYLSRTAAILVLLCTI